MDYMLCTDAGALTNVSPDGRDLFQQPVQHDVYSLAMLPGTVNALACA
jgi:hypothetical protein